jgi:phage shock protein PspC (stress-responsive transcriptional regulator)
MNDRRLKKSRDDRWFMGVIGGIGQYLGLSADVITLIRILVIVLFFGSFFTLFFVYLVIAMILPDADGRGRAERRQDYYERYGTYQTRWEEKEARRREKYARKAEKYENKWDSSSFRPGGSTDRKMKEAEKIDDDDWSDF